LKVLPESHSRQARPPPTPDGAATSLPRSKMSCRINTLWRIGSSSRRVVARRQRTASCKSALGSRHPDGLGRAAVRAAVASRPGSPPMRRRKRALREATGTGGGPPVAGGRVADFTAHDPPSRETQQGRGHSPTPGTLNAPRNMLPWVEAAAESHAILPARSRAPCDLGAKRFVAYHDAAPARPSGRTLVRRRNSRARSC
jgi:hypothetical protein